MKKSFAELKGNARQNLAGHYGVVILSIIIVLLLSVLLNIPFFNRVSVGLTYNMSGQVVVGFVGIILISLISYIASTGLSYMHLSISRQKKIGAVDLVYGFTHRPDRFIVYWIILFLIFIICLIPGIILLVISGLSSSGMTLTVAGILVMAAGLVIMIILYLGLALSINLMIDHQSMRVTDAMSMSFGYMRGNKWRLFILYISFIGWVFLGICTLFIGFLWIIPYVRQSLTEFYLDTACVTDQTSE